MLLHIDENVPDSVAQVFVARGHAVRLVRDLLPRGTPDVVVATLAVSEEAIVVTWDRGFRKLATRQHLSRLNVIIFRCDEAEGPQRAQKLVLTIERVFAEAQQRGERLSMEITRTTYQVES